MDIVLIYWKTKEDKEAVFLKFWEEDLRTKNKSRLIAEYWHKVNEPGDPWFKCKLTKPRMHTISTSHCGNLSRTSCTRWLNKIEALNSRPDWELKTEDTERVALTASRGIKGHYAIRPEELRCIE